MTIYKHIAVLALVLFLNACASTKPEVTDSSIPFLIFDGSELPCISYNVHTQVQRSNSKFPIVLNRVTRKFKIDQNRRNACVRPYGKLVSSLNKGKARKDWYSCDEFPMASTEQGGTGAQALIVKLKENNLQGTRMSSFYRKHGLRNGDLYFLAVTNVPSDAELDMHNVDSTQVCSGLKSPTASS